MSRNIFNSIKLAAVKSNKFSMRHDLKLSFKMGQLVPTTVMECLPGDQVTVGAENMMRFAPLISPVMHEVNVVTDFYFVPNRILWKDWENWITGQVELDAPFFYVGIETDIDVEVGSLADYMGIPTGTYSANLSGLPTKISPLQFAAYTKVWDEFYRDQNLQDPVTIELFPGENQSYFAWCSDGPLLRAWEHDYFTAALPFAQKGPSVSIPLTVQDDIPVDYTFQSGGASQNAGLFRDANDGTLYPDPGAVTNAAGPAPLAMSMHADGNPVAYDPNGTLTVDVQADATDINTLRWAMRMQEWLERNARAGTRYTENLLAHWNVKSSDARLQRPEFIGRQRQKMVISEVLATAQNDTDGIAVGTMAGHGISVGGGTSFRYYCEEHGFIIGVVNVQPRTAYQDGLHRSFSRFTPFDYAWPTFAHLGEQEVFNREVKAIQTPLGDPGGTFGYVPRYAEYKFMNSRVAGEMRTTLDYWHLGRIFAGDPALNETFIACDPSTRIFAVTDPEEDHIYAHIFNNVTVRRKLPAYGTPSF